MMQCQRDLVVTVLELAALGCIWKSLAPGGGSLSAAGIAREKILIRFFCFGFFCSFAACIKPTAGIFFLFLFPYTLFFLRANDVRVRGIVGAVSGFGVPFGLSVLYLLHYHALSAFWQAMRGIVRYHAGLDRRSFGFLLSHGFSPVLALFVVFVSLEVLQRTRRNTTKLPFVLAAAAGWLSYLIQGKGFPYQRYPFLIFLLLPVALSFFSALEKRGLIRVLGYAGVTAGVCLMLFFTYRAGLYSHLDPSEPLVAELEHLGGASLSGSVQCMDNAGGCIGALYKAKLVQSTGFIYDCYFLDGQNSVAKDLRAHFESAFRRNPPSVIVVTDSVCFAGQQRTFQKYQSWPWFRDTLDQQYSVVMENHPQTPVRYWSRAEIPFAFRIYGRKPKHVDDLSSVQTQR